MLGILIVRLDPKGTPKREESAMSTLNKPLGNKPLGKSSDGTSVAAIDTLRAFIRNG